MDNKLNVTELHKPENPLNELLKLEAQQLLAQAIEAEVQVLLEEVSTICGADHIFLRRRFSSSSSFKRAIMEASIPPYLARHL